MPRRKVVNPNGSFLQKEVAEANAELATIKVMKAQKQSRKANAGKGSLKFVGKFADIPAVKIPAVQKGSSLNRPSDCSAKPTSINDLSLERGIASREWCIPEKELKQLCIDKAKEADNKLLNALKNRKSLEKIMKNKKLNFNTPFSTLVIMTGLLNISIVEELKGRKQAFIELGGLVEADLK